MGGARLGGDGREGTVPPSSAWSWSIQEPGQGAATPEGEPTCYTVPSQDQYPLLLFTGGLSDLRIQKGPWQLLLWCSLSTQRPWTHMTHYSTGGISNTR